MINYCISQVPYASRLMSLKRWLRTVQHEYVLKGFMFVFGGNFSVEKGAGRADGLHLQDSK